MSGHNASQSYNTAAHTGACSEGERGPDGFNMYGMGMGGIGGLGGNGVGHMGGNNGHNGPMPKIFDDKVFLNVDYQWNGEQEKGPRWKNKVRSYFISKCLVIKFFNEK